MKKNILISFIVTLLLITSLIGCSSSNTITSSNPEKTLDKALEYIQTLKAENTPEEINNIIGVNGELVDEGTNEYYWALSDEIGISVTYFSSLETGDISLEAENILLANDKVDLSKASELSSKVKEGLTYEDFKSSFGNVDGTLVGKTTYTSIYKWVNSEGKSVTAAFSITNNQCTYMVGRV